MKTRSRHYNHVSENEDFWKSFTDILATSCLIFFFIMVIAIGFSFIKNQQLEIEKQNLEQQKAALQLEKEKLEEMLQLVDNIAQKRMALYQTLEDKLKPQLGDDIFFNKDEGKIEITSEVLFDTDKADLKPEGKEIAHKVIAGFAELFDELDQLPSGDDDIAIEFVEIRGHTDNSANGEYNRKLSVDRARSFVDEMIPKSSIYEQKYARYFKASGMSKFQPKAGLIDNQTIEDMAQNRRIEIHIQLSDKDIEEAIIKIIKSGAE